MASSQRHNRTAKRICDFVIAAIGLLIILPLLTAIAMVIRLKMGCPVLFRQVRPGQFQQPFTVYKFRTMREAVDSRGHPLADGERLHPFGIFLRRTSLDELPEFWNVLRGEMSIVGPRPLLMKYLPFYTEEERLRFIVRPGITGWAQVNGRNEASWDDRLRRDIWYVQNQSFLLDIRILWMTVVRVVRRQQVIVDARSAMLNLDEERAGLKVGRV
jgi:lipopolysaccharide/colanic/teichoic acid biosynthesis glycosyltransferase